MYERDLIQRTNVLLITVDDMNYNSPGITGCMVDDITPNIDKLASEGTRFAYAHVTAAICQPSRQSLMTGRYPHNNGAPGFHPIRNDVPTLQEQLNQAGYRNGIINKVQHLAPQDKYCWDAVYENGEGSSYGRDPEKYYTYTKEFIEESLGEGKPFFLMANVVDPHRPFAGSEDEVKSFGSHIGVRREYSEEEIQVPGFLPDIPDVRKELAQYYTSVHRGDESVGAVLRALKETGAEDNTFIMFLSDNGMALPFAKTNCYLSSTRTPWIVRWPGKIKQGVVDHKHLITGIDYMPTILDALGLPQVEGMDGRSFFPLLTGESQDDRELSYTVINSTSGQRWYPMRCIQSKKYGYIYNSWSDQKLAFQNESMIGLTFKAMKQAAETSKEIAERVKLFEYRVKEEFFNLENDPDELHNLIDEPDYKEAIDEMRRAMLDKMVSTNDPLEEKFRAEVMI